MVGGDLPSVLIKLPTFHHPHPIAPVPRRANEKNSGIFSQVFCPRMGSHPLLTIILFWSSLEKSMKVRLFMAKIFLVHNLNSDNLNTTYN